MPLSIARAAGAPNAGRAEAETRLRLGLAEEISDGDSGGNRVCETCAMWLGYAASFDDPPAPPPDPEQVAKRAKALEDHERMLIEYLKNKRGDRLELVGRNAGPLRLSGRDLFRTWPRVDRR
jgi:hypothetical protein